MNIEDNDTLPNLLILLFGICTALMFFILGCNAKNKRDAHRRESKKIQSVHVGIVDNAFSLDKIEVDGHEYLIYRNNGLCHSASCKCMNAKRK